MLVCRWLVQRFQRLSVLNHLRGIMSRSNQDKLVWVDLELTGLDVDKERIIEMACLITDKDLNIIAQSDDLIINQPDSFLVAMGDWCTKTHGDSGLTAAVRASKVTERDAEDYMCDFVRVNNAEGCPLAGNSIHSDRVFLSKYMPTFLSLLHYRIVDVSTIKELNQRWYPENVKNMPQKKFTHRALDDIHESLSELKFYRESIFVRKP